MGRKLRVEYPGATHHVLSRRDRREPIFRDDQNRECFVETLGQACAKTRRETTMTFKWIAHRLAMGDGTNVSNFLAARQKTQCGHKSKSVKSEN